MVQVMAQAHAAHAGGRPRESALPQLIGDADLTEGRLLNGQHDDGVLGALGHAVLQHGLFAADLRQGQFTAFVVEFPEG
jgi:hypothetical protein